MGFGPYIGPCKSTDTYMVQGACSDRRSASDLERIKRGLPPRSRNKNRDKVTESFQEFFSRRFMEDQQALQPAEQPAASQQPVMTKDQSPEASNPVWRAKKRDILRFWKTLPGVADDRNIPVKMKPIPYEYEGSTYNQDGIRITGGAEFINTILPKLKDLIGYENPNSKLSLIYRETTPEGQRGGDRSFAFYIKAKERGPTAKGKTTWLKAK